MLEYFYFTFMLLLHVQSGDVTIVSGLGLAQFTDDDLDVEEPCAASTAGQKTSR